MKAIRKLGSEVEAVIFVPKHGVGTDDVWIAIEQNVLLFQLDSPKMILTLDDATETLKLGENEEETLNEVNRL